MKKDIAYTLDCPFVSRKCKAEKCLAWFKATNSDSDGWCRLLKLEVPGIQVDVKQNEIQR